MGSQVIVAGAGIVGLATALELTRRGHSVTVLEKESSHGQHQTGNNSGVIHSGLYYRPGSLKATLGRAGAASMRRFAHENGIFVDICGSDDDGASVVEIVVERLERVRAQRPERDRKRERKCDPNTG